MQCSDVGAEIFLFLLATSALVVLLVIRPRALQGWLRARNLTSVIWPLPASVLEPDRAWVFRAIGVIPMLMWLASVAGVYCFFHGSDLPPLPR